MHAEEGVLNEVARVVLVAYERERDREGAPLMALDELAEGRRVASLCLRDEHTILLGLAHSRFLRV